MSSQTEQVLLVESLNLPRWWLWSLLSLVLSNSVILTPFWEKGRTSLVFFPGNLGPADKWEGLRREGCGSVKGPKQKEQGQKQSCRGLFQTHCLSCFVAPGRGSSLVASLRTGEYSFPVWRGLSLSRLREGFEQAPGLLGALALGIRLVGGQRCLEHLSL